MVNESKRNANLDLLRIFAMLLIILLHSIIHSGVLETADVSPMPLRLYIRFVFMLSQVCVNCYVLISGYFLVKSKFRLQKLMILWMEVVFYSFVIKLIFMVTGYIPFSIGALLSCFMPVFTGRYWFVSIYFGLYLLSPFLNMTVYTMNKKKHTMLVVLLLLLFSGWISVYPSILGMNSGAGWGVAWFVVLYFTAAWFSLYYKPNRHIKNKIVLWVIISLGTAIIYVIGEGKNYILEKIVGNWYRYDSIPTIVATLGLFTAFLNINVKNTYIRRWTVAVASSTFGVYLIHDHPDFRAWLWGILNLTEIMKSSFFILAQTGVVIMTFITCAILDVFRRKTIGKIEESKSITKFCEWISRAVQTSFNKLMNE